eukprot:31542_1
MVSNPSPGVYTFRSMHNKMITPVDIGTSEPQFEQHPMNYNSSTQQFEIQLSEDGDTYFIRSMETDQYWTVLSSTSLFDLTNGIGHLSLKPLQNGNEYQKFKFYPIERNKFHIESPVSGMEIGPLQRCQLYNTHMWTQSFYIRFRQRSCVVGAVCIDADAFICHCELCGI